MDMVSVPFMVKHWLGESEEVTGLDPLQFETYSSLIHLYNQERNTKALVQLLYQCLPTPDQLDEFNYNESLAAMRDLGILMGSLKRHHIEPVDAVPELEYVLLVLMVKTGLPPRDTLIHYTVWNPGDARIRTYTGLEDEKYLIESVRIAYPSLLEAIALLDQAYNMDVESTTFTNCCQLIRTKLEGMVQGVVLAKRKVSPKLFADELRFYYDSIKVDYDKQYLGPGAVEMPMFVVDHILWSCDCTDTTYTNFKEGYLPYNLEAIRSIYHLYKNRESLVTKIERALMTIPSAELQRSAMALLDIITVLKSFRMPHKKLAESAYSHQDDHHKQQGSGGYTVDILSHIISLQQQKTKGLLTLLHQSEGITPVVTR